MTLQYYFVDTFGLEYFHVTNLDLHKILGGEGSPHNINDYITINTILTVSNSLNKYAFS